MIHLLRLNVLMKHLENIYFMMNCWDINVFKDWVSCKIKLRTDQSEIETTWALHCKFCVCLKAHAHLWK